MNHIRKRFILLAIVGLLAGAGSFFWFWYQEKIAIHSGIVALPKIPGNPLQDPLDSIGPALHPENLITMPDAEQPTTGWSGLWRGQWEGTLDAYVIPIEKNDKKVKAFYSWGTNLIVEEPGWLIMRGVELEDVITFPISAGNTIVFKHNMGDGYLEAVHYTPEKNEPSRAIFMKTEGE